MRNAGQGFVAVQPSSCSLSSTMPPENKKRWQTCIALLCSVTDIRMIRLGSETRWVVGHSSQATIQQHWTALHWRAEHAPAHTFDSEVSSGHSPLWLRNG